MGNITNMIKSEPNVTKMEVSEVLQTLLHLNFSGRNPLLSYVFSYVVLGNGFNSNKIKNFRKWKRHLCHLKTTFYGTGRTNDEIKDLILSYSNTYRILICRYDKYKWKRD